MKKVINLLIAMCVLLQMLSFQTVSAEASEPLSEKEILLEALGVIQADEIDQLRTKKVTRREFAGYIGNMLGIDSTSGVDGTRYYKDVAPNSRFAGTINTLYEKGILKRDSSMMFYPNDVVTARDAAAILLEIAGYGMLYDDVSSYVGNSSLLNSVSGTELTGDDMISIIFQALEMPCLHSDNLEDFTIDSNYLLMYDLYKLERINGVLQSAEGLSIAADLSSGEDEIVIDGITYPKTFTGGAELLGYEVTAYIVDDQDNTAIACVERQKKNKVTEFPLEELEPVEADLKLRYYDEASRRTKNIQLPSNVIVVKNGEVISTSLADAISGKQGTVRVVECLGLGITTVFVREYDSVFVGSINQNADKIYAKHGTEINIDQSSYDYFKVYQADGTEAAIEAIKKGMLLTVYRSSRAIEIYIAPEKISGTVRSVSEDSVVVDDTEYDIEPAYLDEAKAELKPRTTGIFYLNLYGKIAYFDSTATADGDFAFLIKATEDSVEECVYLKLLLTDGSIKSFQASEKVKIDGTVYKKSAAVYNALEEAGGGIVSQMIIYSANDNGEVSAIDTVTTKNSSSDHLVVKAPLKSRIYMSGARRLNHDVSMRNNAVIFTVPEFNKAAEADNRQFGVESNLIEQKSYNCIAYSTDPDSMYCEAVVIVQNEIVHEFTDKDYLYMVSGVYERYDEKDEEVKKILEVGGAVSTIEAGGILEFEIGESYTEPTAEERAKDSQLVSYNELGEGDLIQLVKSGTDEILAIRRVFDYDDSSVKITDLKRHTQYSTMNHGRYAGGYAIKKEDNLVGVSIDGENKVDEIYLIFESAVRPIIVYDSSLRKNKVYAGNLSDIITYDDTGSLKSSSAILSETWESDSRVTFVYKNGR